MKNLIAFLIVLLPLCTIAQKTHTVAAKESLYSIGRLYNVHPRELAAFNNLSINDGLNVGQVIKIPGKPTMEPLSDNPPANTAAQPTQPAAKPAEVTRSSTSGTSPIYHTVEAKEGLYSISKKYNATIAQIRQWNNLSGDNISIGEQLIVGYSAAGKEPVKQAEVAKKETPKPQPTQETPIAKETKTAPPPAPVSEPKKEPARTASTVPAGTEAADFQGGYFKPFYDKQAATSAVQQESGTAGVFKTTSGWEDGKYYCLHNTAPAGSYVKITNPANNRSVYAKVLDLMPDLKQNSSLVIRISNAAASILGVDASEFNCTLSY